eukprot:m.566408 g.566408  ORF g.566408 m.566408 type:complete len:207 (+) comp22252_c0_seq3:113-733(+)
MYASFRLLFAASAVLSTTGSMQYSVASKDGSVSVTVDKDSGDIVAISPSGLKTSATAFEISGGVSVESFLVLSSTVSALPNGSIAIVKVVCEHGMDLPCGSKQVTLATLLAPTPTSVRMNVHVTGVHVATAEANWTAPVVLNWTFPHADTLKIWAPWNRGQFFDALLPSDGGYSCNTLSVPPCREEIFWSLNTLPSSTQRPIRRSR